METLIVIVLKIALSFYILSILYLLLVYYLKNTQIPSKVQPEINLPFTENHIAFIFNGIISETDLIRQIQFLKQQNYPNYSAYFFTDSSYIDANYLDNILIHVLPKKQHDPLEFVYWVSQNLLKKPDAIIVLRENVTLVDGICTHINSALLNRLKVGQCKVELISDPSSPYQNLSKRFFNFIDREAMNASGISAALWSHGFIIDYSLFKTLSFHERHYSDKDLQAEIISRSIHIQYLKEIIIKEKPIQLQEYAISRGKWAAKYFFQTRIGFQLLLEAVKNPSIDKILFGFNYLRPPVWFMFFASIALLLLNYWEISTLPFFNYTAIFGLALSGIVLVHNKLTNGNLQSTFAQKNELAFMNPTYESF